jgi:hypothetical protein
MPATSKAQRRLMALAEHDPSAVYARNKGVLSMTKDQLHDFAATKEKRLPAKKKPHPALAVIRRHGRDND